MILQALQLAVTGVSVIVLIVAIWKWRALRRSLNWSVNPDGTFKPMLADSPQHATTGTRPRNLDTRLDHRVLDAFLVNDAQLDATDRMRNRQGLLQAVFLSIDDELGATGGQQDLDLLSPPRRVVYAVHEMDAVIRQNGLRRAFSQFRRAFHDDSADLCREAGLPEHSQLCAWINSAAPNRSTSEPVKGACSLDQLEADAGGRTAFDAMWLDLRPPCDEQLTRYILDHEDDFFASRH